MTHDHDDPYKNAHPHILGNAIDQLNLENSMRLKPQGWFHIAAPIDGLTAITVHWPDRPMEVIHCVSPGHANQVRQDLSDRRMAGIIEGAD